MEYRLRYRQIPWGVAICVLPGKIIGRLMIDPVLYCIKHWKRLLFKWGKILLFILIVMVLLSLIGIGVEAATEGDFSKALLNLWNNIQGLFAEAPPVPVEASSATVETNGVH